MDSLEKYPPIDIDIFKQQNIIIIILKNIIIIIFFMGNLCICIKNVDSYKICDICDKEIKELYGSKCIVCNRHNHYFCYKLSIGKKYGDCMKCDNLDTIVVIMYNFNNIYQ
jgi:hypothetical protein